MNTSPKLKENRVDHASAIAKSEKTMSWPFVLISFVVTGLFVSLLFGNGITFTGLAIVLGVAATSFEGWRGDMANFRLKEKAKADANKSKKSVVPSSTAEKKTGRGKGVCVGGIALAGVFVGFIVLSALGNSLNDYVQLQHVAPQPLAQQWTQFRSDKLGFTVLLPVEPTHNSKDLAGGIHQDDFNSGDYAVSVGTFSKDFRLGSAQDLLRGFANQFATNPNLIVLTSEFTQFKGNPSLRLTANNPNINGNMHVRAIFVNRKLFSLAGGGSEENWKKIEESFEVLPSTVP